MTDEELEKLGRVAREMVDSSAQPLASAILGLLERLRKAEDARDEMDSARALMAERARRAEEAARWNEARAKERNDFAERLNRAEERAKAAEAQVAELVREGRKVSLNRDDTVDMLGRVRAERDAFKERAEVTEARVRELDKACAAAHKELFLGGGSQESATAAESILAATLP